MLCMELGTELANLYAPGKLAPGKLHQEAYRLWGEPDESLQCAPIM